MKFKNVTTVGKIVGILLCLCCLILAGCRQDVQTEKTPYEENGHLSIDKNGQVVNESGETFIIQGISSVSFQWHPEFITEEALRFLRDEWNVNTVRLLLSVDDSGIGFCTGGDKLVQLEKYCKAIDLATNLGMYTIICWTTLSEGNPLVYGNEAATFFNYIAKWYGGRGNILYEICNEPNGEGGTWNNITEYANGIIPVIRNNDPNGIIIIGTPSFSSDLSSPCEAPIAGFDNIAYAYHFYSFSHKERGREVLENALEECLPIIVSEFGLGDNNGTDGIDPEEGNIWMALLEKYHVGRIYYNLSDQQPTSILLKGSVPDSWGYADLSPSGEWLHSVYTKDDWNEEIQSLGRVNESVFVCSGEKVAVSVFVEREAYWYDGNHFWNVYVISINNKDEKTVQQWQAKLELSRLCEVWDAWGGECTPEEGYLLLCPDDFHRVIEPDKMMRMRFIVESSDLLRIRTVDADIEFVDEK